MRVVSLVKNVDGCTYHRVYQPNKYIDAEVRTLANIQEEDMEWCDILTYNRHYIVAPDFLRKMADKHNVKIVVDTDDDIEVHKNHPNYSWYSKGDTSLQIRQHLMYADAVTVTHERLAERIRSINPNVYVIPNGIPFGEEQFIVHPRTDSDKLRLLYASSVLNYKNTDIVKGFFDGLDVEFVIAGYDKTKYADHIVCNLTTQDNYKTLAWEKVDNYMHLYQGDVLIVPNSNLKFNGYKSNLKILEAASQKMPVICSPTHPYIDEFFPVIYATTKQEWRDAVERMKDKTERDKLGEELYNYCQKYDLRTIGKLRMEVYQKIITP